MQIKVNSIKEGLKLNVSRSNLQNKCFLEEDSAQSLFSVFLLTANSMRIQTQRSVFALANLKVILASKTEIATKVFSVKSRIHIHICPLARS